MRRLDKLKNIQRANILAEQRYLRQKELLSEDRMSMSEFLGDTTDNVETLLKMFSKYQPNDSWFMTVGYANNVKTNVTIKNEDMANLEAIARKLNNRAFTDMVNSEEWKTAKDSGKTFKNPFAPKKVKGESIPSKSTRPKASPFNGEISKIKLIRTQTLKKSMTNTDWNGQMEKSTRPIPEGWVGTKYQAHLSNNTRTLEHKDWQSIIKKKVSKKVRQNTSSIIKTISLNSHQMK